jgi:suppressor for copper-sensitivity B
VAQGRVVFVDVTADWCITCQVNKRLVLQDPSVRQRLTSDAVALQRGDWTSPDERISAYLADHERYGIPFNAVYGPAAKDGIVLPELLTVDAVLSALDAAAGTAPEGAAGS